MKIAILLSGRITTQHIDENIKKFKKYRELDDIYFFISINKKVSDNNYNKIFFKELCIDDECINIEETIEPITLYEYNKRQETNYHNCYSMFYHNKKCWELLSKYKLKYNINFDIVMKYRTDISYDILKFKKIPDENLHVPRINNWCNGLNDQIAIGNEKIMEIYCNCVNHIEDLCKNGVIFHPETLLKNYIILKNITVKFIDFTYILLK